MYLSHIYAVRVLALEEELQETNTSSEVALQSLQVSHQEVRSMFQAQRENKKTAPHPQIARLHDLKTVALCTNVFLVEYTPNGTLPVYVYVCVCG